MFILSVVAVSICLLPCPLFTYRVSMCILVSVDASFSGRKHLVPKNVVKNTIKSEIILGEKRELGQTQNDFHSSDQLHSKQFSYSCKVNFAIFDYLISRDG